jgi:hypothetical protein
MQPQLQEREAVFSSSIRNGSFGIKRENLAHIFHLLRSQTYSNKVLAVLREYSANAWDEHCAAGIPDRPIKVSLPTALEPVLRIRDFGRGLSAEQVFEVYTQYGSSTKRADNLTVGAMGIGSKSAFAYTDSFTVTSWHGGTKSVYQAFLGEDNVGDMNLTWTGPSPEGEEETGIEISMPVSASDINAFSLEAGKLFSFFEPLPEINTPIHKTTLRNKTPYGAFLEEGRSDEWYAVMGCIAYPISKQVFSQILKELDIQVRFPGVLYFNIGEVSIAASREALEYTPQTQKAISGKLTLMWEHIRKISRDIAKDETITPWERRLRLQNLPLPLDLVGIWGWDLAQSKFLGSSMTLGMNQILRRKAVRFVETRSFSISPETVLVFEDTPLVRAVLPSGHYIIRPTPPVKTQNEVEVLTYLLEEALEKQQLTGVPVVRASALDIPKKVKNPTKKSSPTHTRSKEFFLLSERVLTGSVYSVNSKNWESTLEQPSDDDVYFDLDGFKPVASFSLESVFNSLSVLLSNGLPKAPRLVGYKMNSTLPRKGKHYMDWLGETLADFLKNNKDLAAYCRSRDLASSQVGIRYRYRSSKRSIDFEICSQKLGAEHPVTRHLQEVNLALQVPEVYNFEAFYNYVRKKELLDVEKALLSKYPLLNCGYHGGLANLVEQTKAWCEYIKLVDDQTVSVLVPAETSDDPNTEL